MSSLLRAGSRTSGPVRGRQEDDAFRGAEAVELGEQLAEGLRALVVAADHAGRPPRNHAVTASAFAEHRTRHNLASRGPEFNVM